MFSTQVELVRHCVVGGMPDDLAAFEILASTNLLNWVALPGAPGVTNGQLMLRDFASTNFPARFYRVVER